MMFTDQIKCCAFILVLGLSSCKSRTAVRDTNHLSQAIMTGTILVSDKQPVQAKISGNIRGFLATQDISTNKLQVQFIGPLPSHRVILVVDVIEDVFQFDSDFAAGEYLIQLIDHRTTNILREQKINLDKTSDRHQINF